MNKSCGNCKHASGVRDIRYCMLRGGAAYWAYEKCNLHEFVEKPKKTSRLKDEEE